jgi:uncharacterized protein YigE (DUF2233 family)
MIERATAVKGRKGIMRKRRKPLLPKRALAIVNQRVAQFFGHRFAQLVDNERTVHNLHCRINAGDQNDASMSDNSDSGSNATNVNDSSADNASLGRMAIENGIQKRDASPAGASVTTRLSQVFRSQALDNSTIAPDGDTIRPRNLLKQVNLWNKRRDTQRQSQSV